MSLETARENAQRRRAADRLPGHALVVDIVPFQFSLIYHEEIIERSIIQSDCFPASHSRKQNHLRLSSDRK